MDSIRFAVNPQRCTGCGACAKDCVCQIILQKGKDVPCIAPEQEQNCLQCQHCLAVCPTGAISILGLDPDKSLPIKNLPTFEQEAALVRARRSIRQFQQKDVPFAEIQRVMDAAAASPTGCNFRKLSYILIENRASVAKFREMVIDAMATARETKQIPEPLSFIWDAIPAWRERKQDDIFRNAPHALIVAGQPDAPCADGDVMIALSDFELVANAAGLGTLWCGMLKFALELAPNLKKAVGLEEKQPYYCMMFGYPAVTYARAIQRSADIRRVTL